MVKHLHLLQIISVYEKSSSFAVCGYGHNNVRSKFKRATSFMGRGV
jgi:hypothetical protein